MKILKLSAIAAAVYRVLRPIIQRELIRLTVEWIRDNPDTIIQLINSLGS